MVLAGKDAKDVEGFIGIIESSLLFGNNNSA